MSTPDPVSGGVRHPEQWADLPHRQIRAPAWSAVRDRVPASRGDQLDQAAELTGCSPVDGKIHSGWAAEIICTPT
jgi:hypothetical protein